MGMQFKISWLDLYTYVFNLQVPHTIDLTQRFRDWRLPSSFVNWWTGTMAQFYEMLAPHMDLSDRGSQSSTVHKSHQWWEKRLLQIWSTSMNLHSRVLLWRVLMVALPIASTMQRRGFTNVLFPQCQARTESMRHVFWYCSIVPKWWHQLTIIVPPYLDFGLKDINSLLVYANGRLLSINGYFITFTSSFNGQLGQLGIMPFILGTLYMLLSSLGRHSASNCWKKSQRLPLI